MTTRPRLDLDTMAAVAEDAARAVATGRTAPMPAASSPAIAARWRRARREGPGSGRARLEAAILSALFHASWAAARDATRGE